MVRFLTAALLLSAVSASASPAIPSFEFSVANIQASVAALRANQVKAKSGNIGPRLDSMAWDLQRSERDASQLRSDLRFLLSRVRRQGSAPSRPGQPGQPSDPNLRWDVQRFTRDLAQLTRDSQWRLNDLRSLSAQAEKDEALVSPATRLLESARRFKSETNWLLDRKSVV